MLGAAGDFVARIQSALLRLDGAQIDATEISARRYGPSTAAAVLAYKKKRKIINRTYQSQADNIVGKMTIAALDKEMLQTEQATTVMVESISCRFDGESGPVA
jgi:peptidoglycan hydrolase-like protein with peptidoglycan-binding domain